MIDETGVQVTMPLGKWKHINLSLEEYKMKLEAEKRKSAALLALADEWKETSEKLVNEIDELRKEFLPDLVPGPIGVPKTQFIRGSNLSDALDMDEIEYAMRADGWLDVRPGDLVQLPGQFGDRWLEVVDIMSVDSGWSVNLAELGDRNIGYLGTFLYGTEVVIRKRGNRE